MNTLSKRLIQAGAPTLVLAAAPALAQVNAGGCPQPVPEIVGFSHADSGLAFFTNNVGDAGPNVDDITPLPGGGGELITSVTVGVNSNGGVAADFDLVILDDDGVGAAGACGQLPPGTELARISLGSVVGAAFVTADVTAFGVTTPCDGGTIYVGVEVVGGPSVSAGPLLAGNTGEGPPQTGTSCPGIWGGAGFQGEASGQLPNYGIWQTINVSRPQAGSPCPTDLVNNDNTTDVQDLLGVLSGWGGCLTDAVPAPNGDDNTDVQDLLAVLSAWGPCTSVLTNDNAENAFTLCFGTTPFSTVDIDGLGTPATSDGPDDIGQECGFGSEPRQDIWYRFTAPFDGEFTFSLCNAATGFDTILAVYTADVIPPTRNELISCSDDACGSQSEMTVAILSGEEVLIEVGGWSTSTGTGELVMTGNAAAANDDCANALPIQPGDLVINDFLLGGGATIDAGDETCGNDPRILPSLWYTFIGDNATMTVDPCIPASAPGAGDGTDFWMDINISAFCGNTCLPAARNCIAGKGGGVGGPANGECPSLLANEFSFCTALFSIHYLRVAGEPFDSDFDDEPTRYVAFELTSDGVTGCAAPNCGVPPPANDNFENAISIDCGTVAFRTTGATTDGETHPVCTPGTGVTVNDVWYLLTTVAEHTLTVETCDAVNYDSDLVLYTDTGAGTVPTEADRIACNDDATGCAGFSSRIVAVVPAGDYIVRVGGWQNEDPGDGSGDVGNGVLTIDCGAPPNVPAGSDLPENAPLVVGPFSRTFDINPGFSNDGPEPLDAVLCNDWTTTGVSPNSPNNDAWYLYEASITGTATLSLCGSGDTRIAVWPAAPNPPTDVNTVIVCADDTDCGDFSTRVTFPITAGTQYLLEVGTWTQTASLTLNVDVSEAP